MSNSSKQNLQEKIIRKAWEDAEFKKELLSNPKAAIQKELEIAIPDNVEVKVVEETTNTVYLVLPVNPGEIKDVGEKAGLKPQTAIY
ncbi:MAG: NHLP leader peptide family RiPP precursor [Clostridia bacterium]|nr:NHLP leader peptide family RiPP precursor [Clostridia bacterium]